MDDFDDVLLSADCGYLKPDVEIYRLAQTRFKVRPEHVVYIDDREQNVRAAIDVDWNGIVFEDPRQLYQALMEYHIL